MAGEDGTGEGSEGEETDLGAVGSDGDSSWRWCSGIGDGGYVRGRLWKDFHIQYLIVVTNNGSGQS